MAMDLLEQKARFYASVLPSRPNEWVVDEVFEQLSRIDSNSRMALLSHVPAIWPVSHTLCFAYLTEGIAALEHFSGDLLEEWVRQILSLYEKKGLLGARAFMTDIDKSFLGPRRGEAGVALTEIIGRLLPYIRGVSGLALHIDAAPLPSTDTRTIFLPGFVDAFPEREKNFLLYKVLATLQWGQIASRLFADVHDRDIATDPFAAFPDKQLARDLLAALQFNKVFGFLKTELPGMARQGHDLCCRLIRAIRSESGGQAKSRALQSFLLRGTGGLNSSLTDVVVDHPCLMELAVVPWQSCCLDVLPALYRLFAQLSGTYRVGRAELLLGSFDFTRAGETIKARREVDKNAFVAMLATFLEQHNSGEQRSRGQMAAVQADPLDSLVLFRDAAGKKTPLQDRQELLLDNEGLRLPAELAALAKVISEDMGSLPEAYVQAAAGIAGGGVNTRESKASGQTVDQTTAEGTLYDEWDYRRHGYRDDWCTLYEKTLAPVCSSFVAATLSKYRSQLKRLRRQFEMLRTQDRMVRRRRHGDDIDLDALIEAVSDARAGLPPSDRLFTRVLRIERDITAMFLVDMSNSTEGWVGMALKEALVLLTEALEIVGDRYGIYGFSGMRRSRSELYRIKHPEETCGIAVQQRIAAIGPKEYTRMGPPIRHLTKKLLEAPGRIRLLVVISDGKPEDYDDYKGQYAIEDTRKALLEARGYGVSPFCITIDKTAHEYLAHMFGRGNYMFIDKVSSLPAKMVDMYRLLTR
jgi:nitric oxide reductase NorD protein